MTEVEKVTIENLPQFSLSGSGGMGKDEKDGETFWLIKQKGVLTTFSTALAFFKQNQRLRSRAVALETALDRTP